MASFTHKQSKSRSNNPAESNSNVGMGFFEDIAFLMNSGLIRKEVASYMFAGDAIKAWNDDLFWSNDSREHPYWSLLKDFVSEMKDYETRLPYKKGELKL